MPNKKHNWYKHAVVYQIYPRSFKDSNGDGIGDLGGIIEKLDYLNDGTDKSLGVDAIWLNPIYKSPQKDFGYDVSDYSDIDPVFGDLKIFDKLVSEAHRRGIKVIMDFVPNHTSSEHPWFIESRSSRDNPKRDWYIWREGKGNNPPNNWLSVFGGSAWEHDKKTSQYYMHSFLADQPDLNWRNKEVRDEMLNVLKFWLARGVDGFRTDALYHLIKDNQFRDDPPNPNYIPGKDEPYNSLLHTMSAGRPELFDVADLMCSTLGKEGGRFMVSESDLSVSELPQFYKACANKLHAPFNFNFINLPWDAREYKKIVDDFELSLGPDDVPNYVLGNHDRPRVATRLGTLRRGSPQKDSLDATRDKLGQAGRALRSGSGQARARLAVMLILTLRGMSFIYYGDELGMEDAVIPSEKHLDKVGRDPERTPMQWDSSRFSGFSRVKPWLPFFSNPSRDNVESESRDGQSMLNLYRSLIHFRKKSPALSDGVYRTMESGNKEVFAFTREHPNERALIVLNFSDKEQKVSCATGNAKVVCSSYLDKAPGVSIDTRGCTLRPYEGYVFTF